MPTEQAGPEFAPSPKGRSTPGGEPGSERSVGPLSAGALDPEAPGGLTDPGTPTPEIPTLSFEIPTLAPNVVR